MSTFKPSVQTPSILDLFLFQQFVLLAARRNISKMPLSMCALMLPNTVISVCQCQPWILAKLWRSHLLQHILTVFVGMVVQYPHTHRQALLAFACAAPPLSVPVTLTPRQLLDLWQQLILAASTKSFRQLSVVTRIAGDMMKCSWKCCRSLHLCSHRLITRNVTFSIAG